MYRLGAHAVRSLSVLVLLLASGMMAGPALAQGYPWPGGVPGYGDYPGPSGIPGYGGFPGMGGLPGLGGFPGFGGFPGPLGLPGFGGVGGVPGYSAYPGSTPTTSAGTTATPTQRVRLAINDFSYVPAEISIPAGTAIAWVNNGQTQHTTTSVVSGQWDSGSINPGRRWAATFSVPGTYEYYCTIHPDQMRARLTITAS